MKKFEETKAIILNELNDEKVVIEMPKCLLIIDILLEEICNTENFEPEDGNAFVIGYEFLQEQFLELSKSFFEIIENENSYIEFSEPSEEEKESGIYTIVRLSNLKKYQWKQ